LLNGAALSGQDSLYASAAIDTVTKELIVKLVNVSGKAQQKTLAVDGKRLQSTGKMTVLKSNDINTVNSFEHAAVSPVEQPITVKGKKINLSLAPYSFTLLRVKMR
jgi:alpha-N-arabinofuranosidase